MLYVLLFLRYFNISLVIITTSPVHAPTMRLGFSTPAMDSDSPPGKRHFAKEEKGVEAIMLVSLDTLMKYQKCKILIVMTVINRTQTSLAIRCTYVIFIAHLAGIKCFNVRARG